jgi:hypothetical protein
MATGRRSAAYDRVLERQRAVALARHFREAEGLSIAQIADRLGRSPATIKAYFYDPSYANKRPTDSPQGATVLGACWSCTDVDLQAAPRLSLRRHSAGVPPLPDLSGSSYADVGITAHLRNGTFDRSTAAPAGRGVAVADPL